MSNKRKTGIDLFCGLGGFSFGMKAAGYDPIVGVDHTEAAVETYQKNFPKAKAVLADIFSSEFQKTFVHRFFFA